MDEILRHKLEQRIGRRSFLRGSGLAAAAFVSAAAFPGLVSAQDQPATPRKDDAKKDEKKKRDGDQNADARADDKPDDKPDEEQDEFKVTRKDQRGRDYRVCPQCGYNMYKQDRTWTCENCGYSYTD